MIFDINVIKRKMLVKYPFFGSVIANVSYIEKEEIGTAATDGKTILYNEKFLNGLSIDEQTFVLAHEVCHIAFNHILRSEGKNANIWNIATDAVINQFLKKDGLKMIEGAIDMEEAINYDAETLYKKLLKENPQSEKSNGNNENGDSEKQNAGHDSHDMWEEAVEKQKQNASSESDNNSDGSKEEDNTQNKGSQKETKSEVQKKQEELETMGEQEAFEKNKELKEENLKKLQEKMYEGMKQAGDTTNQDILSINNIGHARPLIDWRYILKETTKYDIDWSYKNATIEHGVVTPNWEEIPMPETEIVLDTSGSIDEELLKNFLRECKNILKHTKLKVGCFDTKFYGFHEIRSEKDIDNMEFVGGGGTNFDVAIHAFTKRVENKIIFTDGEARMPDVALDAIWLVFGSKINPKGGKVIYISQEDLNKLRSGRQKVLVKKQCTIIH